MGNKRGNKYSDVKGVSCSALRGEDTFTCDIQQEDYVREARKISRVKVGSDLDAITEAETHGVEVHHVSDDPELNVSVVDDEKYANLDMDVLHITSDRGEFR